MGGRWTVGLVVGAMALGACGDGLLENGPVDHTSGAGAQGGADPGVGGSGGGGRTPVDPSQAPLGAHFATEGGLTIVTRSTAATRIEAWLYTAPKQATERLVVPLVQDGDTWRGAVEPDVLTEALGEGPIFYGLRVWGPNWTHDPNWSPGSTAGFVADVDADGNRFNPNKLILDPFAREMSHDPDHDWGVFATGPDHRAKDSAPTAPKGVVLPLDVAEVDTGLRPERGLEDHIIYEVHLRGLTMQDPSVPEALRGTYAGAALKAAYLADLGVTAIELLPLHETQNDQNDLTPDSVDGDNYWGYSTLSYFAPDRRYAADKTPGGPTRELRAMVRAFHEHGIAVLVDVVYNHTGEGGHWDTEGQVAPLISWRGLDNAAFYKAGFDPAHYHNSNGVGPDVDAASPLAQDMVLASLRYWHEELGVDGFRFDLASVMGNLCDGNCFAFDPQAPMLTRPVAELPHAILIAEPWAIGPGTYQVGNFPAGWAEWNDGYRDDLRADQNRLHIQEVTPGWLANRMSGSWERFGDDGRPPWASINFLVAHDGLTLRDLYGCNTKNNGLGWPYGPSDGGTDNDIAWDQGGNAAAQRQATRTGLALLMLSAGTPMITGGDERYRSLFCNNNPYNLDSPGNWLDWSTPPSSIFNFARSLMRFRLAHPALRPDMFRPDGDADNNGLPNIGWFEDDGGPADAAYLDDPDNSFIGFRLDGEEAQDTVRSIYVGYNGWDQGLNVTLPPLAPGHGWYLVSDTHAWLEGDDNFIDGGTLLADEPYLLGARAMLLLVEKPL